MSATPSVWYELSTTDMAEARAMDAAFAFFCWTLVVWTNILIGTAFVLLLTGKLDFAHFSNVLQTPWSLFADML